MTINKKAIIRLARNLAVSIAVLFGVIFIGGVAYIWYSGNNDLSGVTELELETPERPGLKTIERAANNPVGVSVQSISSPISPGSVASISIRTTPDANCVISVIYNKTIISNDPRLITKTADEYGMANWSWMVEPTVPLGKWPVKITCSVGEKSGMVVGDLVVAENINS